MAEQYTPTTEDVRTHWADLGFAGDRASFDRWLAARDAQVRAEALGGTRVEYAVAREEHPSVPVYKRRDLESAEAFVLNPPLGEKRHRWLIISRLVLTDNPWTPTNHTDRTPDA